MTYQDFLRRLCQRAAENGRSDAARSKVSFSMKTTPVMRFATFARHRRLHGPVVEGSIVVDDDDDAGRDQDEKVPMAPLPKVAEPGRPEAPTEARKELDAAYKAPTACVALLRQYFSQERFLGVLSGALIFEADGVQYPLQTVTPIRCTPSTGAELLSLGSLFAAAILQDKYEGHATPAFLKRFEAKKLRSAYAQILSAYLSGRTDSCSLLLSGAKTQKVSKAQPSLLNEEALGGRSKSAATKAPMPVEELRSLPGQAEESEEEEVLSPTEQFTSESESSEASTSVAPTPKAEPKASKTKAEAPKPKPTEAAAPQPPAPKAKAPPTAPTPRAEPGKTAKKAETETETAPPKLPQQTSKAEAAQATQAAPEPKAEPKAAKAKAEPPPPPPPPPAPAAAAAAKELPKQQTPKAAPKAEPATPPEPKAKTVAKPKAQAPKPKVPAATEKEPKAAAPPTQQSLGAGKNGEEMEMRLRVLKRKLLGDSAVAATTAVAKLQARLLRLKAEEKTIALTTEELEAQLGRVKAELETALAKRRKCEEEFGSHDRLKVLEGRPGPQYLERLFGNLAAMFVGHAASAPIPCKVERK